MTVRRRPRAGRDQVLLRSAILVGTVLSWAAAAAAGAGVSWWVAPVVLGLALLTAALPDSAAGAVLLLATSYLWLRASQTYSPLVLVVAAGMLLAHMAALVAAQGPGTVRLDPVQVRLWAVRGVVAWLAALAVWTLGRVMRDVPDQRFGYATGLIVLAAAAVAIASWLSTSRGPA